MTSVSSRVEKINFFRWRCRGRVSPSEDVAARHGDSGQSVANEQTPNAGMKMASRGIVGECVICKLRDLASGTMGDTRLAARLGISAHIATDEYGSVHDKARRFIKFMTHSTKALSLTAIAV